MAKGSWLDSMASGRERRASGKASHRDAEIIKKDLMKETYYFNVLLWRKMDFL
jgi:hypothetical protein